MVIASGLLKLLAAVFAVGVFVYSCLVLWYRRKYRHLPCPKPVSFFFGHTLAIRATIKRDGHMYEQFTQWAKEYGSVYVVYFLHKPTVLTWDPAGVKELLVTGNFPKSKEFYENMSQAYGIRFMGNGLVTDLNHTRWSKKRQEMNPAFHKSSLKELTDRFNTVADQLIEQLGIRADNNEMVEIGAWLHKAALSAVCMVAFAKDIDCLAKETPFSANWTVVMKKLSEYFWDPMSKLPFISSQKKEKFGKALGSLKDIGLQWTKEREAAVQNDEYTPNDILNRLVEMKGKGLFHENENLMDEFMTFFVAGHETTANTLSFMIMQAGRHPEILQKMYDEVDEVLGQKAHISYEDANKLDYIYAVWKESLRMFPIAPMTQRHIDRDGFKIAGYDIPKGSVVAVSQFVSSRMPSLVKNPMDYKPERFLGESDERPSTYSYFPFSIGPRNCIGQNFANLEGRIFMAKFLQNFRFKLDPTQSFGITDTLTLKPADNVRATVSWRKAT